MLLAWNAIVAKNEEFLRDEKGAFIPSNEIQEAIESALVFYHIKKDKTLETLVKRIILNVDSKPKLKTLAKEIKKEVFTRHPYHLEIPAKIYLPDDGLQKIALERFDFKKKEFVERTTKEIFKGTIELSIPQMEEIKVALTSYARGLAQYEHEELKGTILEEYIISLQNSIANEWEMTLRIGAWTKTPYKGDLLFFWRIKEVRQKLLREFKHDIRPKNIYFIPKFKEFVGWCEYRD